MPNILAWRAALASRERSLLNLFCGVISRWLSGPYHQLKHCRMAFRMPKCCEWVIDSSMRGTRRKLTVFNQPVLGRIYLPLKQRLRQNRP